MAACKVKVNPPVPQDTREEEKKEVNTTTTSFLWPSPIPRLVKQEELGTMQGRIQELGRIFEVGKDTSTGKDTGTGKDTN